MSEEDFFKKVYEVAMLIPKGKVTSYGAIAKYLGSGQSARMVGWAMNASNTSEFDIPAHRVVNRNGALSGKHHFGDPGIMQQLLENEGIVIENDKVMDFKNVYWDPTKELS
jgi:methylated-DNA-protein-cysteine methyltransferase-like protein